MTQTRLELITMLISSLEKLNFIFYLRYKILILKHVSELYFLYRFGILLIF